MHESEVESEVAQSCRTLRDSMECGVPGSFIHGIFQARVLEWGAIAFSGRKARAPQLEEIICKGPTFFLFLYAKLKGGFF